MELRERADAFLAQKRIAVVGVSRSNGTGNGIYDRLQDRGYEVFAVNPNTAEINGKPCYPSLGAIPGGVGAVVIATRPEVTEQIVQECAELGIGHIWMHYNALFGKRLSSVSKAAVELCREQGINVIPGGCPLMFDPAADGAHKCMRWILGITGGLPRGD
jgi:predicted CoA-binding protein